MAVNHETAYATGPGVINFQGKVVNADGTNVTNGTYNFDFVMYDDAALGTPSDGVHDKWHELTKSVTVTNGVFQTNLGSATALPNFNTNPSLYLAVRFNADAAGYMTPRVQMTSVPYALNADNLGGIGSSGFTQLSPAGQQTGSINISGTITAAGAGNNSFTGTLQSAAYLLGSGPDLSLQPVSGGQSVITTWWGLQLVGNKQSTVTYTPTNIGTAGQYGVIIPSQLAGSVALLLKGAASQTGDLFEIQDSTGAILTKVDSNGDTTLMAQHHLQFADADSSNWVAFQAPAVVAANVTWTLPSADSAGCLQSDGAGTLSIASCGDTNMQTFSSNSNYTVPTNALMVIVEAWGGGGGGGGGTGNSLAAIRAGGAGGGGGAYTTTTMTAASLGIAGTTVPVTIGAAGTAGPGGTTNVGTAGGAGGTTCLSTVTACGGNMYLETFGGAGGLASSTGNGGGGGGGTQSVGVIAASGTGGAGGSPLGALATLMNSGSGGAGGGTAAATGGAGGSGNWGGGGGGASSTTGAGSSGAGGGSNQGGAGGGAGASCAITTCTLRSGGSGGHVPGLSGGGGTAGVTAGQAGGAGSAGVGSGGDGGGGGANTTAFGGTAGAGGAGGTRGGGGGGGGASAGTGTQKGGAGGAGGAGYLRTWTLRGAGADLAEIYCTNDTSLMSGDAVAIDPTLKAGVRKTAQAYDHAAIGIISTSPGLTTGNIEETCAKPVLVALAGRVPLKVSLENGPIKSGDLLTASSTPGVAMKAVKAGTVIGQALTAYDGSQPEGFIVAFVQNSESNGTSLTDLIPGLDSSQAVPVSQQALTYLVSNKDKAISSENLSEISTDRVTAGLEIITPSVVTDALTTNSIGSSGSGDITFLLDAHNKLVVKGRTGGQAFSIDATGNATFGVSLITLGDIESKGGLTVDGDALFNGAATFAKLAQFQSDIDAQGRVTFNKDAGGTALITKGGTRVDVVFDKPYDHPPIVSTTLLADQVTLPDGTVEDSKLKEQRLFNAGYSYLVSNSSSKGFTIVLNKKAAENLQFNWNAVAIKDPTTTTGSIDTTSNQPVTTTDLVGGQ